MRISSSIRFLEKIAEKKIFLAKFSNKFARKILCNVKIFSSETTHYKMNNFY